MHYIRTSLPFSHTHSFTKVGSVMQGSRKPEGKPRDHTETQCERHWCDCCSSLSPVQETDTLTHTALCSYLSIPLPVSPAGLPSHLLCDSLQDSHCSSSLPLLFPPLLIFFLQVLFLPQHLTFFATLSSFPVSATFVLSLVPPSFLCL